MPDIKAWVRYQVIDITVVLMTQGDLDIGTLTHVECRGGDDVATALTALLTEGFMG